MPAQLPRTAVAVFYSCRLTWVLAWPTTTARLIALTEIEILGEALFHEIINAGVERLESP